MAMNFNLASTGMSKIGGSATSTSNLECQDSNGKVERSHRTDDLEFYQLLTYVDDVNLNKMLKEWENYYNFNRPHKSLKGKTPYEILREKLHDSHLSSEF